LRNPSNARCSTAEHLVAIVFASLVWLAQPEWLAAQGPSCETATNHVAALSLESITKLVARTDTAAARIKAAYGIPSGLNTGEIVVVTADSICAQAAQLYYMSRDSVYAAPKAVFVIRLRDIYYVQEPHVLRRTPESRGYVWSIIADSSLATVLSRLSSY
jgi:hypothetical protein